MAVDLSISRLFIFKARCDLDYKNMSLRGGTTKQSHHVQYASEEITTLRSQWHSGWAYALYPSTELRVTDPLRSQAMLYFNCDIDFTKTSSFTHLKLAQLQYW